MWVKQTYPMDGEREGNMGKLFFFFFFLGGGGGGRGYCKKNMLGKTSC